MNLKEYSAYDAVGLAELVRKKQVSASELSKLAFLSKIAEFCLPLLIALLTSFSLLTRFGLGSWVSARLHKNTNIAKDIVIIFTIFGNFILSNLSHRSMF